MTAGEPAAREEGQGSGESLPLEYKGMLYSSLVFHLFFLFLNFMVCRWAFRRGYEKPIDLFDATELGGLLFAAAFFGFVAFFDAKAVWILLGAATRLEKHGQELLVVKLFGTWRGPGESIRLRKLTSGWPGTLGRVRYRLELAGGVRVAEVVRLSPDGEGVFQRLEEWFPERNGAEDEGGTGLRWRQLRTLIRGLAVRVQRWPWVGKLLWVAQIMGGYVALGIGVLRFWRLSLVSWFALVFLLMEAFVMLALLGGIRAGGGGRRGVESAVKATQVGLGVFIVSVFWDWLGRLSGMAWLVMVVGFLQAMAIVLEWAVPGSVFLAFTREAHEDRKSGEREEGRQ